MAEWTNAAVLKTVMAKAIVGSNPTPTAIIIDKDKTVGVGECVGLVF